MGVLGWLLGQMVGRAQVRADLVNVGAHGTVRDLFDLAALLPPRDAAGESASDAVLLILGRASKEELAGLLDHDWPTPPASCTDFGTLALAAFHHRKDVREAARAHLRTLPHPLARTLLDVVAEGT